MKKYICQKNIIKIFLGIVAITLVIFGLNLFKYQNGVFKNSNHNSIKTIVQYYYSERPIDNILVNVTYEKIKNGINKNYKFQLDKDDKNTIDVTCSQDDMAEVTLLSEVGERFDGIRKFSDSEELLKIIKEESKRIFDTNRFCYTGDGYEKSCISTSASYFARSFAFYYVNGETNKFLRENAPKTYSYIEHINESMEE